MPIIAAVISSAALIGGSLIGSNASQNNTDATNASNANLNIQNQDWQQMMSNTAMSRRVSDLKTAGLNPLLAVSQGGASTPGFSPIPMQKNDSGDILSRGIGQSGQAGVTAYQNAKSTNASVAQQNSQTEANAAQARLASVQADKLAGVDTDKSRQDIDESKTRQLLMDAQAEATSAQAALSNAQVRVADASVKEITAKIHQLGTQSNLNEAQARATEAAEILNRLTIMQQKYMIPEIIAQARMESVLKKNELQESAANAKFWQTFGASSPTLKTIMPILEMLLRKPANVTVLKGK